MSDCCKTRKKDPCPDQFSPDYNSKVNFNLIQNWLKCDTADLLDPQSDTTGYTSTRNMPELKTGTNSEIRHNYPFIQCKYTKKILH